MKTAFRLLLESLSLIGYGLVSEGPESLRSRTTRGPAARRLPTPLAFSTAAVLKNEIRRGWWQQRRRERCRRADLQPRHQHLEHGPVLSNGDRIGKLRGGEKHLYVFGGSSDGVNSTNAVWAYTPRPRPGLQGRHADREVGHSCVVEKNIIYVIGGAIGHAIAAVESYNPATNTWTEEAPMLVAKSQRAAGLIGTTLCSPMEDCGSIPTITKATTLPPIRGRRSRPTPRPGTHLASDPLVPSSMTWAETRRQRSPMIIPAVEGQMDDGARCHPAIHHIPRFRCV